MSNHNISIIASWNRSTGWISSDISFVLYSYHEPTIISWQFDVVLVFCLYLCLGWIWHSVAGEKWLVPCGSKLILTSSSALGMKFLIAYSTSSAQQLQGNVHSPFSRSRQFPSCFGPLFHSRGYACCPSNPACSKFIQECYTRLDKMDDASLHFPICYNYLSTED